MAWSERAQAEAAVGTDLPQFVKLLAQTLLSNDGPPAPALVRHVRTDGAQGYGHQPGGRRFWDG